ncbi:MAG: peptidase M3 [Ignavibacteriales bacterium]|nr:peptidase M3 [Ignavibacteriales bacterium]
MNSIVRRSTAALALVVGVVAIIGCQPSKEEMESKLTNFIADYEAKVKPLEKEANVAYFEATISGKEEDYQRAGDLQVKLSKIYADKEAFAALKEIKESEAVEDELLKRQLEVLYNAYAGSQIEEEKLEKIIQAQTDLENRFSTFRATIDGKEFSDNQIEEILKTSTDNARLEAAWKASKAIGPTIVEQALELVKLRNEAARELGYDNHHAMSLTLDEQDPEEILALMDELDELTRDEFARAKKEIDARLAKRYGISEDELEPWHYQNRFFQEAPKIHDVDLDKYYKDEDIAALTDTYFDGVGLEIDDLLAKSDLYEKEGKYQHAYCTDIDRSGDVRVVCNIKPNYSWTNTTLHEFGHAVYDKYINMDLPYSLRSPAHTFTTEAVAMFFGRMAANAEWMAAMEVLPASEKAAIAEASFETLRLEQLVFSRWAQVVYRFEKAMYENPDQDLNKLWWDLVEKYQMIERPEGRDEPDWVTKIHIALYPAYYHNYLLGELLASQFYFTVAERKLDVEEATAEDVLGLSFANDETVGEFFRENVFAPGARYSWNEMIERATGEKLTAKYYAKQFVKGS